MKKLASLFPNRLHTLNRLGILGLSISLANCSMAPAYHRPQVTLPQHYPTSEQLSDKKHMAADIGWQEFYSDPVLQQLIAYALNHNHDLKLAVLNTEAIEAQYRLRRADAFPHLTLGAESNSQRLGEGLAYNPRMHQVGINSIAWELDLWGRVRNLSEQALQGYFASKEVQMASQLSLIAAVAHSYLSYKADQAILNLTRATLETQQKSYDLAQKRLDVGQATRFDLRQAEIALRTAQVNYSKFLRITAQDRNALVLLLGAPLTSQLAQQLDQNQMRPDQMIMQTIPIGLPSDLLTRRPDIRAIEHQLQASNAHIGAARAAFFPSISLTGSAGTASASLDELFSAGTSAWSFIPKINIPIFTAGSNKANLDRAQVMKRIEIVRYDQTIQTAFREVADGLAGKSSFEQQIKSQQQLVEASREAYHLASLRFNAGEDNYLAVLDAQRTLYTAEQVLIQTRLDAANNQVNLYKALGGGWNKYTLSKTS